MSRSPALRMLLALALSACASGGQGEGAAGTAGGYVSTPGHGGSQHMSFEPSGRVFGENFDLITTSTGYRGVLRGQLTSMESNDGLRITGSRGGSPIDLHVEFDGVSLRASGLFAGRLGRLLVDPAELTSNFGRCSMQLARKAGLYFAGQRACSDGWIAPAAIQLPAEFAALPAHRQVMLLSTLLYL